MDGLQWDSPVTKLETIMPGSSFLTYSRGENGLNGSLERLECPIKYKRTVKKQVDRRGRGRTQPVTFAEIKVVLNEIRSGFLTCDWSIIETGS